MNQPQSAAQARDTLRGIGYMVIAMGGFALADLFIKILVLSLPISQVLTLMGIGGILVFGILTLARGLPLFTPTIRHPAILIRGLGEIVATVGFINALSMIPLSTASAILQLLPLVVTLAAALILRETVGWRRWLAVIVGFLGVLVMIAPTPGGTLNTGALVALIGVLGLSVRDLSSRFAPKDTQNLHMTLWGFFFVAAAGLMLATFGKPWIWPTLVNWAELVAMLVFAAIAYMTITAAMRIGDVSAVAPFRYTRIIFAFALSMIVLNEALSARTLIGATLVVAAGLYAWMRERNRTRTLHPTPTSG
jgi:drug/metabolite transporter (DMT)-like permease